MVRISLKQSGMYDLLPQGVEHLVRDLPTIAPEIELLRKILLERTHKTLSPEFDPGMSRAEAVVQLRTIFENKETNHA